MNSKIRAGVGVDVHMFSLSAPCFLAGLEWPEAKGLEGHSDGDAAVHALCDAVLSACQLGDMGELFGVNSPEWSGASGLAMIEHLKEFITKKGFVINNVALQIVGNEPKISPRRVEAQELLSRALGAPVSISATTTDTLGFTGRGEGVFVIANAIVQAP